MLNRLISSQKIVVNKLHRFALYNDNSKQNFDVLGILKYKLDIRFY